MPFRLGLLAAVLLIGSSALTNAAETSLRMTSEPGDYIGAGQEYFYTPEDGTFTTVASTANGAAIRFTTPSEDHWWYLDFAAPFSAPLAPGIYLGARRSPFVDPSAPSLDVRGDGRGCSGVAGSFRVREASYSPTGEVESFWGVFEQHCEGRGPALRGDIRINAQVTVAVTAPFERVLDRLAALQFDVSATDPDGRHVTLSAGGLPDGASFTDHGDNTGTFSWVPGFNQRGDYEVTFRGDNGAGGTDEFPTAIRVLGTSSLLLESDSGDFIGEGSLHFFTSTDGEFDVLRDLHGGVSATFLTRPSLDHFWHLDFAAPFSAPLSEGSYLGATRYPFQDPADPGLDVSGDGRGCNTLTGRFDVKQIEYGQGDEVRSLWATFEQHCEGGPAALRGELRVNADVPIVLSTPTTLSSAEGRELAFEVSAIDSLGGVVMLSAEDAPTGARFVDHGDNTGTFRWTPTRSQIGTHRLRLTARNARGETDTRPVSIEVRLANDEFEDALDVSLPSYTDSRDTSMATWAPDDPSCLGVFGPSVWYALTPTVDVDVEASTEGSDHDTTLSVYVGPRGGLDQVVCGEGSVRFQATAGRTYHLMVARMGPGGNLRFSVRSRAALALSLDRAGSFDVRTGVATLSGTATCASPNLVVLRGLMRQFRVGSGIVEGEFEVSFPCAGRTRWTAATSSRTGRFRGGSASASVAAFAVDQATGQSASAEVSGTIGLRGLHPMR